ncbi:PREDICTED: tripartite motif-containing protein 60-like [Cyprinodon variegatus]|uniref:tripartite motif-containing protein 60-like n=1 Tax=Cyprinodon variegatus TaxID=28743 RepID=UPI000742BF7D|nr:PREDICTED: tripartite motif-containing protein 60-like [Cyprinodon variegatus]
MAELHIPVRINHLSCRICGKLFENPATILCGHNFCMGCIKGHWGEGQRDLSCPECGKIFPSRPNLIKNTTLTDMLRDTKRSSSRKRKSQESAESLRDQRTADTPGKDKHNGHISGLVKDEPRRKQVDIRRFLWVKDSLDTQPDQRAEENDGANVVKVATLISP